VSEADTATPASATPVTTGVIATSAATGASFG
jgi:hypothetical protein